MRARLINNNREKKYDEKKKSKFRLNFFLYTFAYKIDFKSKNLTKPTGKKLVSVSSKQKTYFPNNFLTDILPNFPSIHFEI